MVVNVAVLGSSNGTDLQAIINAIEVGSLTGIKIKFVLSNVETAGILVKAREHNITPVFLSPNGRTRSRYDAEVSALLKKYDIDLVLLIGYMKLLTAKFVDTWQGKVMNIHPSLLPAFAGMIDKNIHQAVLDRGCRVTGATLIFIDAGADTGPIISQRVVNVRTDDTIDTLKKRVQQLEGEMFIDALAWWRDGCKGLCP